MSWTTVGYYEKSDEYPFYDRNIGGTTIERPVFPMMGIVFLFHQGKFGGVLAYPRKTFYPSYQLENFWALKVFLFSKFGPGGTGSMDNPEFWEVPCSCVWEGDNTVLILSHDGGSGQGMFYMYDKKLHELVMAEYEQKEKEKQRQQELKDQEEFEKWKVSIIKRAEQGLLQEKGW